MFNGEEFGKQIVAATTDHINKTVAPLLTEIGSLKAEIAALKAQKQFDPADIDRRIETITTDLKASAETAKAEGKEKRKAAIADLKAGIIAECETMVAAKIAELPTPPEPVDFKALIDEAIAELDGKRQSDLISLTDAIVNVEVGYKQAIPDIPALIRAEVDKVGGDVCRIIPEQVMAVVAALPPAEKGKDADPELVASLVKETVERAVAALPVAKDGKSVTVDDVRPLIEEAVLRVVADIPVPKDGKDGLDAVRFLRGDKGNLLVTMSNGTVDDLGEIDGRDGNDVDMAAVERSIADAVKKIIPPEIERDAYLATVTKMIDDAVAKQAAPVDEFAPDDVAANVALAVKMMAETSQAQARQEAQPINVYSSVTMPEMKAPDTVVNLTVPEQAAPVVNMGAPVVNVAPASIEFPKRGKEVTTVTGWDKSGRIKSFEKREVDE